VPRRNPERRPAHTCSNWCCLTPFGVIGANMGCKLFVALQLEVAHHFIERCADGPTGRFEAPATLGATKTPKTLLLNPHQLPAHGRLCRCAPTSNRLLSRDEAFWFAINGSFRSGVLPDCNVTQSGRGGRFIKDGRSLHAPIWMVCRASYKHGKDLFVRTFDFEGLA
jgi:hypothetical protein